MTAEQILTLARAEIGTKEQPAGSNTVKYNTAYYNRKVSGSNYSWCAVFIWWLFRQAGASALYYGGGKTAYCPTLLAYHKAQTVTDYKPGDIIFFNFDGKKNAAHVGLCEAVSGRTITTIDGNTGTGNEANGGCVMRRTRSKKYIVGAYRPKYGKVERDLTEAEVRAVVKDEMKKQDAALAGKAVSTWAAEHLEDAKKMGLTDGTRPGSYITREEAATMAAKAAKYLLDVIQKAAEKA